MSSGRISVLQFSFKVNFMIMCLFEISFLPNIADKRFNYWLFSGTFPHLVVLDGVCSAVMADE